jgi:hypothetical protein
MDYIACNNVVASRTELKLYASADDKRDLMNSRVIRASKYERALGDGVSYYVSDVLGGKQSGVVATLSDGRRFLVVKGNQYGRGSRTVLILADHMTEDWVKTGTKEVSTSTLEDFAKAGGDGYNVLNNNGEQAAERMMALP